MSVARNDPCPCGSGRKYKRCCLAADREPSHALRALDGGASEDPDAAWQAELVPLTTHFEEDPTARPAVTLVVADGIPIHIEPTDRAPTEPADVAAMLERAVVTAAESRGELPAAVEVRHPEVAEALARTLGPRDVEVRVTQRLDVLDAIARDLIAAVGLPPDAPAMSAPVTWSGWGLPETTVAELFRAAAAYHRAAPWRWVANLEILHLDMPGGEHWTACVLGNGGEQFGLALYADIEDFIRQISAADDPDAAFRSLEEPVIALDYAPYAEIPRPMQKEIAVAGWEVAGHDAYPILMALNTPGGGLTRRQAKDLIDALRAIPPFVDEHRAAFTGEVPMPEPVEWTDPATGVHLVFKGVLKPLAPSLWEPPEELTPGGPQGPAARPEAALDVAADIDALREAQRDVLTPFADSLDAKGLSAETIEKHLDNADIFIDFLAWYHAVPLRAVTEYDLRVFLYDWCPRKVMGARTRALAMPTSLRRFFRFLADEEGIDCPWARRILLDKEAFEIRYDEFPGGFWWDEGVSDWRAELYADLDARVMLPDRRMAGDNEWGATMGPDEAALQHELERRWLLWRDEVIRDGTAEPDAVRRELVRRQRAWEKAPHAGFGGKTVVAAVKAERRARKG